jgi:hypothetical protein
MNHELLGKHKASSEWYTPDYIWEKIKNTFDIHAYSDLYDPCPRQSDDDGMDTNWVERKRIYVNPPTPAAQWAKKAIKTVQKNEDTSIIFAAFSEAVLWQVPELLDYPICWVRNRINWIDGNEWVKCKQNYDQFDELPDNVIKKDGIYYRKNSNYLKISKAPRNYNSFVLLKKNFIDPYGRKIERKFCENFSDLGIIQLSREIYKP